MKRTKKQREENQWLQFLTVLVKQVITISCIVPMKGGWRIANEGNVKIIGPAKNILGREISMATFKTLLAIVGYKNCVEWELFYRDGFFKRMDLIPKMKIILCKGKQLKHSNKVNKILPKLEVEEYAYLDGLHWKEAMIGVKEYSERKYDWKQYSHRAKKNRPSNKRKGDYRIFR